VAGPGGGAAPGGHRWRHRLFPLGEPARTASAESRECSQRTASTRRCVWLPALVAMPSSPDCGIVALRVVAGLPVPDNMTILDAMTDEVRLAQHQALSAVKPAVTANGSPPATRKRVVLLPHSDRTC
jgi:hypothetical protein